MSIIGQGVILGSFSSQIDKGIIINSWSSNNANKPQSVSVVNTFLYDSMFYNRSGTVGYWNEMTTFTHFDNWNLTQTNIPTYCFGYCANLNFSKLPSSIITLGNYCFQGCYKLNCEEWDEKSTLNIGNYSFNLCNSLSWNTINTCNRVNSFAFNGCTSLGPKIKIKAKYISRNMFNGCNNITKVWLASRCTNLFGTTNAITGPFSNCTNLTDIYLEASAAPTNFNSYWGYVNASCQPTIHYGTTEAQFNAL